jgi:hypothetical protein
VATMPRPKKKRARVPGIARPRRGARHIEALLYEKHGIVFEDGERVVSALPVPGDVFAKPKEKP